MSRKFLEFLRFLLSNFVLSIIVLGAAVVYVILNGVNFRTVVEFGKVLSGFLIVASVLDWIVLRIFDDDFQRFFVTVLFAVILAVLMAVLVVCRTGGVFGTLLLGYTLAPRFPLDRLRFES